MLEFFRQLVTGVSDAWQRLSLNARAQIISAALLSILVLVGAVYLGSQPQMVRLYSRLDLTEANEIVVWLQENDIPYDLRDNGATVLVPVQHVQASRMGLAAINLPQSQGVSSPGFELFSNRDLMTNEWLQNVDFMRALQGEAERQLNQMDFVRGSKVIIREAPEQIFASEQKPSQASVVLETNRQLSKAEVKTVVNIVASLGGPNLTTRNIAVADTSGVLLHSPVTEEFAAMASDRLEARVGEEEYLASKIRRMFTGLGVNAVVEVAAVMDWQETESQARQVQEGTLLSEETTSSNTTTTEAPPQGEAGALANVADGAVQAGGTQTQSTTEELTSNFDPSETLTTTRTPAGTAEKYTVAAFVEGNYEEVEGADGAITTNYVALTDEQITTYQTAIMNVVGGAVDATEVVVYDHPIRADAITSAAAALSGVPWYEQGVVQLGIHGLLIILAFFLIRIFMRRAMTLPTVEEEEVVDVTPTSPEEARRAEVAMEVERLAREDPEAVAALLRTWLAETD